MSEAVLATERYMSLHKQLSRLDLDIEYLLAVIDQYVKPKKLDKHVRKHIKAIRRKALKGDMQ